MSYDKAIFDSIKFMSYVSDYQLTTKFNLPPCEAENSMIRLELLGLIEISGSQIISIEFDGKIVLTTNRFFKTIKSNYEVYTEEKIDF